MISGSEFEPVSAAFLVALNPPCARGIWPLSRFAVRVVVGDAFAATVLPR